jgi:hypothetical protein
VNTADESERYSPINFFVRLLLLFGKLAFCTTERTPRLTV